MARKAPRFVPPLVFATAVAGVIPACGGESNSDVGHSGGEGGGGGTWHMIVLAVAGFTGTGGRGAGGRLIVLAVAGFTGFGGFPPGPGGMPPDAGTDGSDAAPDGSAKDAAPDVPIIILAMAGFAGPRS